MRSSTKALAFLAASAAACGGDDPAGPGNLGNAYSPTVLVDGPVAYWRFEEVSGTVAADSSGLNRAAAYLNTPTLGDSVRAQGTGKAVAIRDTDEGVLVDYAGWTNFTTLTVEVWVRPDSVTSSEGVIIVDKGSTWNLFLDPLGRPAFQFPGNVPPETLSPTPLVIGQTYHLAATYGGGAMNLYVNGALVSDTTGLGPIPANSTEIHMGRGLSPNRFGFRGVIDEVALYDKVLSAQRILAHYNAGS